MRRSLIAGRGVALFVAMLPLAHARAAAAGELPSPAVVIPQLVEKLRVPFEGKDALQCDSVQKAQSEVLSFHRTTLAGAPAWKVTFRRPFECRWQEPRKMPLGMESVEAGKRQWVSQTRGVAWITSKKGALKIALEDLQVTQRASPAPSPTPSPAPSPTPSPAPSPAPTPSASPTAAAPLPAVSPAPSARR